MDGIQKKLVQMVKKNPDCINDRKILRATMLDLIPQEKLRQNLILNAFDEDIIRSLTNNSDATLRAIQMIKGLSDSYGLTEESAVWAVTTWCYMLSLDEISDAITEMAVGLKKEQPLETKPLQQKAASESYHFGSGVYKAGYDFPAGEVRISAPASNKKDIYYALIGKGSNKIIQNGFYVRQMILEIKEGQKLEVRADFELINI